MFLCILVLDGVMFMCFNSIVVMITRNKVGKTPSHTLKLLQQASVSSVGCFIGGQHPNRKCIFPSLFTIIPLFNRRDHTEYLNHLMITPLLSPALLLGWLFPVINLVLSAVITQIIYKPSFSRRLRVSISSQH